MEKYFVRGGRPLSGDIECGGSKNASLPVIFATLICPGVTYLCGLPDIRDVRVALEILSVFGAEVEREGDTCRIDTGDLHYSTPPPELLSSFRASTYLIGSAVPRFGRCPIGNFGGCNFSARPIDMHIAAARAFGAKMRGDALVTSGLHPATVTFANKSVGATVNALLLAAATEGESRIENPATEPHIIFLVSFLRSAGADIEISENSFTVRGGQLHGTSARVIPDMIEAGTYIIAGLVTGGRVRVRGVPPRELSALTSFLSSMGASVSSSDAAVSAVAASRLDYAEVTTAPYPGYPTDMQPQTAVLLAKNSGGKITDTVFPERFGYLSELAKFGIASARFSDGAVIYPSEIKNSGAKVCDLRAGAACLLAALAAEGESVISDDGMLTRGYSSLVSKLRSLGADIDLLA